MSRPAGPARHKQGQGLQRVAHLWGLARATLDCHRRPTKVVEPKRPGSCGVASNDDLVVAIRRLLTDSPFSWQGPLQPPGSAALRRAGRYPHQPAPYPAAAHAGEQPAGTSTCRPPAGLESPRRHDHHRARRSDVGPRSDRGHEAQPAERSAECVGNHAGRSAAPTASKPWSRSSRWFSGAMKASARLSRPVSGIVMIMWPLRQPRRSERDPRVRAGQIAAIPRALQRRAVSQDGGPVHSRHDRFPRHAGHRDRSAGTTASMPGRACLMAAARMPALKSPPRRLATSARGATKRTRFRDDGAATLDRAGSRRCSTPRVASGARRNGRICGELHRRRAPDARA